MLVNRAVVKLSDGLLRTQHLVELNLCNNDFGDPGAVALARYVRSETCKVKVLLLSWNKIGPKGGVELAQAMSTNRSLVTLSLQFNCIGAAGYEAYVCPFSSSPLPVFSQLNHALPTYSFGTHLGDAKLKFLDLSFNGSIENAESECDALIAGLWANKSIRTFEFNGNDITASSLRKMVTRAVLGFEHCFDSVDVVSEEEARSEGVASLRQAYDRLEGAKGAGQDDQQRKERSPCSYFTQAFRLTAAEVR